MQLSSDDRSRPLQRRERDVVVPRVEQAVDLSAARVHQLGQALLGQALLFHPLRDLPGDRLLGNLRPASS
jgi:hypothetical protein